MKRIVLSLLLAFGGIVFCMAQEMQEVVYLKNGSIIRGTVIEQVPGKSLKIQTNDGSIFAYEMSEVEKITKEQGTSYRQRGGQRVEQGGRQGRNGSSILDGNGVQRGYRGFFDIGYTVGTGDWDDTNRVEFATSHGYQFNPYFYAGLGVGVNYYHQAEIWEIPIFADLRVDILNNWITPYVDFRIGYSVYDATGFYMSPMVGCRFDFGGPVALNFGIGYTMQKMEVDYGYYYRGYYYYADSSKENMGGFSIKLGIEF